MADLINSSHFWPTEISCKNIVLITWEWCEPRHFPQEFQMAWSEQFFRNMTEDSSMFLWSTQSNSLVIRDLKFNYRTTICCNYCGCACVYVHTWNIPSDWRSSSCILFSEQYQYHTDTSFRSVIFWFYSFQLMGIHCTLPSNVAHSWCTLIFIKVFTFEMLCKNPTFLISWTRLFCITAMFTSNYVKLLVININTMLKYLIRHN